jgi:Zn-dependent peptidase ImmA (M78 family)/transcriptional regulator with XRE-family HTH domain
MPARIEAIIKPELLVWARKDAGYSIETAADKLKIKVEKLEKWESGNLRPTINQLRKAAALYKRPLSVFYLPRPPKTFQPLKDFRRFPDHKELALSPSLIYEIRLARERRDIALELFNAIEEAPPQINFQVNLHRDPEIVATEVRQQLNIPIEHQFKWPGYHAAFNAWRRALENRGMLVFQAPRISPAEMRGFSIFQAPLPVIVVNTNDWIGARIFSLSHEFIHILRNEESLCDFSDAENRSALEQNTEVFCNRVAGALIVPAENLLNENIVRKNTEIPYWDNESIQSLARSYKVSREVILRRLLLLGKTTNDFYLERREEYQAEAKPPRKYKEVKIPVHIKILARTGRNYAQLILTSFNREKITASDLSGYLGIKLKHVAKLEAEMSQPFAAY